MAVALTVNSVALGILLLRAHRDVRTTCPIIRIQRGAAMQKTASAIERQVRVEAGPVTLEGDLEVPEGARGIVLFAHGSGSSRQSPRNRSVARQLQAAGLATLLIDLLTKEE